MCQRLVLTGRMRPRIACVRASRACGPCSRSAAPHFAGTRQPRMTQYRQCCPLSREENQLVHSKMRRLAGHMLL
eukprot:6202429-Pleurochrysis_carterae.AAC.1